MVLASRPHLATREPMLLCTEQHDPKRPLADHCPQLEILKSSILALTEHRARSLWRQAAAASTRAAFLGAPCRKTFVAQARSVRVVRRASMGEWWDVDLFVAKHRVGASGPPQSRSCSSCQHAPLQRTHLFEPKLALLALSRLLMNGFWPFGVLLASDEDPRAPFLRSLDLANGGPGCSSGVVGSQA